MPRYTYIFAIDQYGKGTPIFPPLGRAVSGEGQSYDFEIGETYGTDTYFLLTSIERINNPDVFDFDGVRSSGGGARGSGQQNQLSAMLSGVGTTSRSPKPVVPANWGIERAQLISKAPEK